MRPNRPTLAGSLVPIVYLPGATGRSSFWRPVADRLWRYGAPIVLGYPGFGDVPPDSSIDSLSDLYGSIMAMLPERFVLVAQSMGSILALRAAIEAPSRIDSLILCAPTGGIDVHALGGDEWREQLTREESTRMRWFVDDKSDYSADLSGICAPTLLLIGGADALCPMRVGEFLTDQIPTSELKTLGGGGHWMAVDSPDIVAAEITRFLASSHR